MLKTASMLLTLLVSLVGGIFSPEEPFAGGGYAETITQGAGGTTVRRYNAAGAQVSHDYPAGFDPAYEWLDGGLLAAAGTARGGNVVFGYSLDGARDLVSATWPGAASGGGFSYPPRTEGYGRDAAGRVNALADASGTRGIEAAKGRPFRETWSAGALAGWQVEEDRDGAGRRTGFTVRKDETAVHAVDLGLTPLSGEVAPVSVSGLTVDVLRDGNRRVTGFDWGGVAQSWTRDATGRITAAGATGVPGAESFSHTTFDAQGKRLTGTWTYEYDGYGQLKKAVHPAWGTFEYTFDAAGRRTGYKLRGQTFTAANGGDALNRFVQTGRPQSRVLTAQVAAGARVWLDGVEGTNSGGTATFTLASPGSGGGWKDWTVRGIVAGAGESGADPDAKAVLKGSTWFPPASETFVHDAAGNRQSSARWNYGWDSSNRLRDARTKDYATAPEGWHLSFDYDSEGRRFRKTVKRYRHGTLIEDNVITFIWNGWELAYERHETATGTLLLERRYAWGPDLGGSPGSVGGAGGLVLVRETKDSATTAAPPSSTPGSTPPARKPSTP